MFVTSGSRNATSANVADYRTFVTGAAARGHARIREYSYKFHPLISTSQTNARTNTGYDISALNGPVYWLNGEKADDNGSSFWDGSWDSHKATTEAGTSAPAVVRFFTGSQFDGSARQIGGRYYAVGPAHDSSRDNPNNHAEIGELPIPSGRNYVIQSSQRPRNESHRFIAVSSPFRVAPILSLPPGERVTTSVAEGDPITFAILSTSFPADHSFPARVRITDDANVDFLDSADEGVHTITMSRTPTTIARVEHTVPTRVVRGNQSGSITVEILESEHYRITVHQQDASKTIQVRNDATRSARALSTGGVRTATESDGPANLFVFQLARAPREGETVSMRVAGVASGGACRGTATPGSDFTAVSPQTIAFGTGETSKTLSVQLMGDEIDEDDEVICVRVDQPMNMVLPGGGDALYASALIADDDPQPVISVSAPSAGENGGELRFGVTLDRPSSRSVTLDYADSGRGTATAGDDYTAPAEGTLTFAPGETRKTVTVTVANDEDVEEDETVVLRFSKPGNASLPGGARNLFATGTIESDDRHAKTHRVALRERGGSSGVTVREGGKAVFHADLTGIRSGAGAYGGDVSLKWSTLDGSGIQGISGSAAAGSDYTAVSKATATIRKGETSVALEVQTLNNAGDEKPEGFQVRIDELVLPAGRSDVIFDSATATGIIYDGPTLSIADAPKQTEGQTAVFPLTLSPAVTSDVKVLYTLGHLPGQSRRATAGEDYEGVLGAGRTTIKAGETRGSISVKLLQDSLDEPEEVFIATIHCDHSPCPVDIGRYQATGRIGDDDPSPGVSIADVTVTEGDAGDAAKKLTFTVKLDKVSGKPVRLRWATRAPARNAATLGEDYSGGRSGMVTIPAGSTTATIGFDILGDDLDEPAETFGLQLFDLAAGTAMAADATATITDNDPPELSIGDVSVTEGGTASFTVSLSNPDSAAVTVTAATSDGTAEAPGDYTHKTEQLTVPAGAASAAFAVATREDTVAEPDETFTVTLSNPGNATIATASAEATITDDDGTRYWIGGAARNVAEGSRINVQLRRSRTGTADTIFACLEPSGSGAGHATLASGAQNDVSLLRHQGNSRCVSSGRNGQTLRVRFAADASQAVLAVNTTQDNRKEGEETFRVSTANINPGQDASHLHAPGQLFTIVDDDIGRLRVESVNSPWEGQPAKFEIYVDDVGALQAASTNVFFTTSDGTAEAGDDYTAQTRTRVTLTRPASAETPLASFTVATTEDSNYEADETFTVTLSGLPGHLALDRRRGVATATIRDDDTNRISLADALVNEGDRASVAVQLTRALSADATVTWKTVADSAVSPADFTGVTGGVLVIPAGDTSAAVTVQTAQDSISEKDESFEVAVIRVSDPNVDIGRAGVVTIRDNDDAEVTVSGFADATVAEHKTWTSGVPAVSGTPVGDIGWSLQGDDAAKFAIDARTGKLTLPGQNFEAPADKDKDNDYEVTVVATDQDGNSDTQAITVTVRDGYYGHIDFALAGSTSQPIPVREGETIGMNFLFWPGDPVRARDERPPLDVDLSWEIHFPSGGGSVADANDVALPSSGGSRNLIWNRSNRNVSVADVTDDETDDPGEEFEIRFTSNAAMPRGGYGSDDIPVMDAVSGEVVSTLRFRIVDDDSPAVVLSATSLSVNEADDPATPDTAEHQASYTVRLDQAPAEEEFTINLTAGANAAVSLDKASLRFDEDNWSEAQTVTVTAVDDHIDNAADMRTASITHTPAGAYADVEIDPVTVTVADNDTRGVVIAPASLLIHERDDPQTDLRENVGVYSVVLATQPTGDVEIGIRSRITVLEVEADATSLKFTPSDWDDPQEVTVTSNVTEQVDNPDERQIGWLEHDVKATGTDYAGLTAENVIVSLTDQDLPPTGIEWSVDTDTSATGDQASLPENGGAKTVRVTATVTGGSTFSVQYGFNVVIGDTSDSAGLNTDYAVSPASPEITIGRNKVSGSATFTLTPTNDALDEDDETISISGNPTGIEATPATITIIDDDPLPSLAVADASAVTEGDDPGTATNMRFTVSLSAASGKTVTAPFTLGGDADAGDDFTAPAAQSVSIAPGSTSADIVIPVKGDTTDEEDETVTVTLGAPTNATVSTAEGAGTAQGEITDDDDPPVLSIDAPKVAEGTAGATAALTFKVTLAEASGKTVTVDYADTEIGTAASGTDYVAVTAGTLTFMPGDTEKTVAVSVTGDVLSEGDETVVLRLSAATNATLAGNATTLDGTGVIEDDDDAPALSVDAPSVDEGDSGAASLTFKVSLSAASGRKVTVAYEDLRSGTAKSGTDYDALASGVLTFAPGETSKSITVTVRGDTVLEPDETVVLRLHSPVNAGFSAGGSRVFATGAIRNDDRELSIGNATAAEGDKATFTVSLDSAHDSDVKVTATTSDGTAAAPGDYTHKTQELTIAAGATSATFEVQTRADTVAEGDETFTVTLSEGSVPIAGAKGTGTISDAQAAITVRMDGVSEVREDSPQSVLRVAVRLVAGGAATPQTVPVTIGADGDSAVRGTDYQAVSSFNVVIQTGQSEGTATFRFTPIDDNIDEPSRNNA